jgi:hypothetical protein
MAHLCLRQVGTSFRTPPSPRAYLTPADPSEAADTLLEPKLSTSFKESTEEIMTSNCFKGFSSFMQG